MKTSAKKKTAQAPKARVILVTWHKGSGISPEVIDTFEAYTTITGFCKAHPEHNPSTVMYWVMRRKQPYATQDVTVERIPLHKNKR